MKFHKLNSLLVGFHMGNWDCQKPFQFNLQQEVLMLVCFVMKMHFCL